MTHDPQPGPVPRWHRRLSVRLGAGVVLVLVAAMALAGIWIDRQESRRFEEQHREHAAQVSVMVGRTLSERMLAGGGAGVWRDVTAVSRELKEAVGAARILVLSRDGRVKATTDPALEGHRFSREGDAECAGCHVSGASRFPASVIRTEDSGRLLRVVGAIDKQPACAGCHREPETFRGMIAVDFDLSALDGAARARVRLLLAAGAAAAAGMALFIFLLLRSLVHAPIADLVHSAQVLGEGNLGFRIRVRRDDELGLLTSEFNRMAGRIQRQVDHIEAGRRETELLYSLVVEVSQSLEVAEVRGAVLKVLRERLPFRRMLFCVQTAERSWSTEILEVSGEDRVFSGGGELGAILSGGDAGIEAALPGVPPALVREVDRDRAVAEATVDGTRHFALPFEHRGRLAGIVVASHPAQPKAMEADARLLYSLSVHIGLALDNALNFTQSITDGLTGLANKRHGLVRLAEALYVAKRHGIPVSLMMVDIDFFKRVNDAHGHLAGDAVLRAVAERIRAACRSGDVVARYGGEEFMIVLPHTPAALLAGLGERLRRSVEREPVPLPGGAAPLSVTVSIGATACDAAADTPESIIARADEALYAAKRAGRNRVMVAAPPGQS
ncbi:MAG: diguanylate cyclase [Betaproteobacteria bacterium]|nr:diguanylate cyclase [Betaproteobacteria bacterium]